MAMQNKKCTECGEIYSRSIIECPGCHATSHVLEKGHSTLDDRAADVDDRVANCLRWTKKLFRANVAILVAYGLVVVLFVMARATDLGLGAVLFALVVTPILIFIGLANLMGLIGSVLVVYHCKAYGVAARLLAVSIVPIGTMFYFWNHL